MHIHILGIAGTFMGGIARLAKSMGHQVTGSEKGEIYPPMSTQLIDDGIRFYAGYDAKNIALEKPDCVLVGNAVSRGNPELEYVLSENIPYFSAPEWLLDNLLRTRHVLAVSGTHGKTTTTSLLTWILAVAKKNPGYLVGGVPQKLQGSAYYSDSPYFVIEADEYDTAFFDKRSKFIHYRPRTLIINNLEYDHADIFPDLAAIQTQFHHLVRTVPGNGQIIHAKTPAIETVLAKGCWTPCVSVGLQGEDVTAINIENAGNQFTIVEKGKPCGTVHWNAFGEHQVHNALTAFAAARHIGIPVDTILEALSTFELPARRLTHLGVVRGIALYDDFAHHPTAIAVTLKALRAKVGDSRLWCLLELRSNSMKQGVYGDAIVTSLAGADQAILLCPPTLAREQLEAWCQSHPHCRVCDTVPDIISVIRAEAQAGDSILVMSNGDFGGIQQKLLAI